MPIANYNPYELECFNQLVTYSQKYKNPNNFVVDCACSYNSWFMNDEFKYLRGLLIDGDILKVISYPPSFSYKAVCKMVNANNICSILKENGIPKDFFILSLDIDGADFFVLMSLLKEFRPKIICTEYNEKIPYPVKFAIKNDPNYRWGWNHNYGYSVACVEDIMKKFNYRIDNLIMNNVFLIRNDDGETPNIDKIEEFYKKGYLFNPVHPHQEWNADIEHLHKCKTKEEVEYEWRKYFLENKNVNNGTSMINEVNNYLMNDDYEKYLKEFLSM